jgi:RecA-family ATPase
MSTSVSKNGATDGVPSAAAASTGGIASATGAESTRATVAAELPNPGNPGTLRRISISEVLSAAKPRHDFLLPGLPRGAVGALVGPGGTGKTALALSIAVSQVLGVPTAGDLFPAPSSPRTVAFITGEEGQDECAIRLHSLVDGMLAPEVPLWRGARRAKLVEQLQERLAIYPGAGVDLNLIRDGTRTEVLETVRRFAAGVDLLILETVSRLHNGDENAASAMAALVNAVESVARSANAAVLLIHHSSKAADLNGRGDSQHAARGNSAFVDNLRYVANIFGLGLEEAAKLGVGAERKKFLRFEVTKANYVAPQEPRYLRRLDDGVLRAIPLGFQLARTGGSRRAK